MLRATALLAVLVLAVTGCATAPDAGTASRDDAATAVHSAELDAATRRCTGTEGFSVAYPADWSTNTGAVVAPCTFFGPAPFLVGSGPGLRAAPIRVAVEPGGFALVTKERAGDRERAGTVIAGARAVRIVRTASERDLWPTGTPVITYAVDLAAQPTRPGGTLVLDLVGLPRFDIATARPVLDRMARSVRLGGEAPTGVVARYRVGLRSVLVRALPSGAGVCLSRPPLPPPRCFASPAAGGLQYAGLVLRQAPALVGGVTGGDVFLVVVDRRSGPSVRYLPVPVAQGAATRGWAVRAQVDRVTGVSWYDALGRRLGRLPARDLPGDPSLPPTKPTA